MKFQPWRVVVVRAWRHEDGVAAVLRVSGSGTADEERTIAAGSAEAACAALAAVLEELTGD